MDDSPAVRDLQLVAAGAEPQCSENSPGRLIAVVVGVDCYRDPAVPTLACCVNDAESVANAVRQTQPADLLDLSFLTNPTHESNDEPTRENLLIALQRAASLGGRNDTFLLFFAGHGGLLDGRPCLFPSDLRVSPQSSAKGPGNFLHVDEIQSLFAESSFARRVMFLDCCQTALAGDAAPWGARSVHSQATSGMPWRTGCPVTTDLVEAFQQLPRGWSLVLSCGPNEVSLEDPEWGQHGIFSHFLAAGLRGQADLDGDGVVSLAELSQFLAQRVRSQARAVIDDWRNRGVSTGKQDTQNPTLVWGGPMSFPLTRCLGEDRSRFHARVVSLWARHLLRPAPCPLAMEGMVRYGTAILYGLAVALCVLLYAAKSEADVPLGLAAGLGFASGMVWLGTYVLAVAANSARWHTGGYVSGGIAVGWHLALLVGLIAAPPFGRAPPVAAIRLGVDLLVLLALMTLFGYNAVQASLALADLVQRDERVVLRRAFAQLDRRWVHAEVPNVVAMVSAHATLYQLLGLGACLLVLAHVLHLLVWPPRTEVLAWDLAQSFVLIVLIEWLTQWYIATYYMLRRTVLPER